jgi:branched-subunit amino acid transport protein
VTEYSSASVWFLIVVIGLGTFSLRFLLIALADKGDRIPPSIQRALRFIPPAVLAAIAGPAFLRPEGAIDVSFENLRLFAGLVAYLVAWRTKSVLWTIVSGMVALWILEAML